MIDFVPFLQFVRSLAQSNAHSGFASRSQYVRHWLYSDLQASSHISLRSISLSIENGYFWKKKLFLPTNFVLTVNDFRSYQEKSYDIRNAPDHSEITITINYVGLVRKILRFTMKKWYIVFKHNNHFQTRQKMIQQQNS